MKVGIFLTCQYPPGSDMIAALEGQYAMTRLARDRGWDAVATGQHYLSEGVRQVQLIPFLARLAAEAGEMTGIAGVLLATLHNPVEVAECMASLDAERYLEGVPEPLQTQFPSIQPPPATTSPS